MDSMIVPYVGEPASPRESPLGAAEQTQEIREKMEGVFHSHFSKEVRPYFELIDSLRVMGINKDLSLPAIAVIGDQSSGKSSVLEALSGVALPRGSGIVTRCPLMLKLRKFPEWMGIISYKDITKEIEDSSMVGDGVFKAQEELAGKGVGISSELITLEIRSPEVWDLTLIDLPGIARVPVKGQRKDIGDQIKSLIHKFIDKEETINLVVVPCNVDIATTEALRMAQEVDPEGKRTLAVLTKPDLVDCGTEKNILDVVDNRVIPLTKGYIVVKCRGQQQIEDGISLPEATRLEREFFKQHIYFRHLLDEGKATTQHLTVRLTDDLVHCIKNFLPTLSEQIKEKLDTERTCLNQYMGGPPTDPQERALFLTEILIHFNDKIKRLSEGKAVNKENLFVLLREHYQKWKNELEQSKPLFHAEVVTVVKDYNLHHRGRELPGFSDYDVFEKVTQEAVMKLKHHALQTLRNVRENVEKHFNYVTKSCFSNYPFLELTTMNRINRIQAKQEAKMEERIKEQFEMENLIYTQDSIFSQTSENIGELLPPPSPRHNNFGVEENLRKTQQVSSSNKRAKSPPSTPQNTKRARMKTSSSGLATVVEVQNSFSITDTDADLDILPTAHLDGGASSMNVAYETMTNYPRLLYAYYKIMIQRQADQIPMQIQYFLVKKAAETLRAEMLGLLRGEDVVDKALSEVSDSSQRRKELHRRIQLLTEAQEKLSGFL